MTFLECLHTVVEGIDLSAAEARTALRLILEGQASPQQIAAFLIALKMKGESADEITGFAQELRARMTPVPLRPDGSLVVDTCGTGGDGLGTFNISTTVAFVVAACGLRVAKHGNRSVSSRCGSADVLEALGVAVNLTPQQMAERVDAVGVGFLFAPLLHPALKAVAAVRQELKLRTVFNLLGPLVNPAEPQVQLIGAADPQVAAKLAESGARLGMQHGIFVSGHDGLDEVTITTRTTAHRIVKGVLTEHTLYPEDFGLQPAHMEDLIGGNAQENAAIIRNILTGQERGPKRDIVLANTAALLVAAKQAPDWTSAASLAAEAIDSGRALDKLNQLISI